MKLSLKELTVQLLNRTLRSGSYRGTTEPFWGSLSYGESYTGITVNRDTALNYIAYWACVRLLTETLASLPFLTNRRLQPRGKERATDHPLYSILHDEPNPEMDSFTFFETLMYHLVAVDGNCYAFIDYEDDLTTIKHLWLMSPDKVTPARNEKKEIVYQYQFSDGVRTIPGYRVWHVPGLGYDGLVGYTPLTLAREAIGLGLATEKFGGKLFSNGTNMGGFLEHPGHMTTDAQKRFEKTILENGRGLDEAHKWIVLEEGMKATKLVMNPEDAQMLQTRKFQRSEMASFFHIPPHMIGDLERATFSNIEEQSLEFVIYTMRPWFVRFERSAKRKLLSASEKQSLYFQILDQALLRGDIESRYRAYAIARNWGWMSANDVLDLEDRNGIGEQGDIYMAPQNMIPADQFDRMLLRNPPKPGGDTRQSEDQDQPA